MNISLEINSKNKKQRRIRELVIVHPKLLGSLIASELWEIDDLPREFVSFAKESRPKLDFAVFSETESLPKLGLVLLSFNTERLLEEWLLDSTLSRLEPTAQGSIR